MWKGWLGDPDFVHTFLQNVLDEHAVLLSRIPLVEDFQSTWVLLLHCAILRPFWPEWGLWEAGFRISRGQRSVPPGGSTCRGHNVGVASPL